MDLDAIARNYGTLCRLAGGAQVAGVVKADAYGLGAAQVAPRLAKEGCRTFFVATAREGEALRKALQDLEAEIFVFHGYWPGERARIVSARLIPVLNSADQIEAFRADGGGACAIHFDTGMNRLGLSSRETEELITGASTLAGLDLRLIMSHLACAEAPDHPKNGAQRDRFADIVRRLPPCRASLANTGAVLLGEAYHFDLVRPGIGLYGAHPANTSGGPFEPVVAIEAPILQLREIAAGETIGYGAQVTADRAMLTATLALGYADGFLRAASPGAAGRIGNTRVPLLGSVSMDLSVVDVSAVPGQLKPGDRVRFLASAVNETAAAAGTIGYELLTRLGSRLTRVYESDR